MAAIMALAVTMVVLIPPMPSAQAQLFGLSEQEEIRLGRQVEAEFAKTYGFVNDPEKTRYVASVGLRLARVSERPNLPWTYHIVDDKSVNAVAAPGGYVFVTKGLMSFVKSEDELGFVLGHETTHIAHRHVVELAQRQMEVQLGAVLVTQILFGGSLTAYQLSRVAGAMMVASYSREKEYEADHYGVIFAKRAGWDPRASVSFFERLRGLEGRQGGLGSAFASHPPTTDRIKAVRIELRQMGYQVAGEDTSGSPAPAQPPVPQPAATPSFAPQPPSAPTSRYPYEDR
jgi:beta-barrel assembly-enhancing protease